MEKKYYQYIVYDNDILIKQVSNLYSDYNSCYENGAEMVGDMNEKYNSKDRFSFVVTIVNVIS